MEDHLCAAELTRPSGRYTEMLISNLFNLVASSSNIFTSNTHHAEDDSDNDQIADQIAGPSANNLDPPPLPFPLPPPPPSAPIQNLQRPPAPSTRRCRFPGCESKAENVLTHFISQHLKDSITAGLVFRLHDITNGHMSAWEWLETRLREEDKYICARNGCNKLYKTSSKCNKCNLPFDRDATSRILLPQAIVDEVDLLLQPPPGPAPLHPNQLQALDNLMAEFPPASHAILDEAVDKSAVFYSLFASNITTLKYIPKLARCKVGKAWLAIVRACTTKPDDLHLALQFWAFPKAILAVPPSQVDTALIHRHKSKNAMRDLYYSSEISKRLRLWETEEGKYDLIKAVIEYDRPHRQQEPSSPKEKSIKRCLKLIQLGRLKDAVQALSADEVKEVTPEVEELLKSKFPNAPTPPIIPPGERVLPLTVEADLIKSLIKKFPKDTGCGRDGWRAQYFLDLLADPDENRRKDYLDGFTAIANLLLSAEIPDILAPFIASANLIPLDKKDGGVRPICVGGIFRRLASGAANFFAVSAVTPHLKDQMGVGHPGGLDAIIHAVDHLIDTLGDDPTYCLLKLDFKNAFNLVERSPIFSQIRTLYPPVAAYIEHLYTPASHMYYGSSSLECSTGTQQGDPLAPLLFSVVLQLLVDKLLVAFPDLPMNAWYLDDGNLVVKVAQVNAILAFIAREGPELGLHLNTSKSEVWWPSRDEAQWDSLDPDLIMNKSGATELLGSAVGEALAVEAIVEKRTAKILEGIGRLEDLEDAQCELLLLSKCLGMPRFMCILRSVHSSKIPSAISKLDKGIDQMLSRVLFEGASIPDHVRDEIALPTAEKYGGLGFPRAKDISKAAFPASQIQFLELTKSLLRNNNIQIPQHAIDDLADINLSLPVGQNVRLQALEESKTNIQHLLTGKVNDIIAAKVDSFYSNDPRQAARRQSVKEPHAKAFMHLIPNSARNSSIPSLEFTSFIKFQLGVQLFTPPGLVAQSKCANDGCNQLHDQFGEHATICGHGGAIITRHDRVKEAVAEIARSAGYTVQVEPRNLFGDNLRKPADVRWPHRAFRGETWCDITVVSAHKNPTQAKRIRGYNLLEGEKVKRAKYRQDLEGRNDVTFTPVVFDTLGGVGPAAIALLKDLARSYAVQRAIPASVATGFVFKKLSGCIAKTVGGQIARQQRGGYARGNVEEWG